jgi:hypothetical protein
MLIQDNVRVQTMVSYTVTEDLVQSFRTCLSLVSCFSILVENSM